jgi:adenosylmethionine-8-amino-7-oxononanoate aminotransferase
MIWAFDLAGDDPLRGRRFYVQALKRSLLLRPLGNTVYFMPPYVIGADEMEHLVSGTLSTLEACAA